MSDFNLDTILSRYNNVPLLPMLCLFLPLLFLLTSFLCLTLVLIELEENLPLG